MISDHMHSLERRLNLVRGRLIAQYAHIEFRLADIYVKYQKMDCYAKFSAKFPRSLNDRLKGVEKLLTTPGPLDPYAERLRENIRFIEGFTELRHFLVHGYGALTVEDGNDELIYRLYQEDDEREWSVQELATTIADLEKNYEELNRHGNAMWHFFKEIYTATGVER